MSDVIIKSKERIKDHGEVFTPNFIVKDMLVLVANDTNNIFSRFLEPACGDGNFLNQVLINKLNICKKYKKNQNEFEKYSFISISSIYGIDLLNDNVENCKSRLFDTFKDIYTSLYKNKISEEFLEVVSFVLDQNILNGDALSLKRTDIDSYIIFPEWSFSSGSMVKRRDFIFKELADFNPNENLIYSKRELSDLGESVFSPSPVREYPVVHYMKVKNVFSK